MSFTYTTPGTPTAGLVTPVSAAFSWAPSSLIDSTHTILLAHMDGSGADSSVNGYNLTNTGATFDTSAPKFGSGDAKFTNTSTGGSRQLLSVGVVQGTPLDILSGTGDFTIEGWFKLDSSTINTVAMLLDFGSDTLGHNGLTLLVSIIDPTTMAVTLAANITDSVTDAPWGGNGTAATISGLSTGNWYHFAVVRTAGTGYLFVNGNRYSLSTGSWTNYAFPANSQFQIGNVTSVSGGVLPKSIDEVRISNIAQYTGTTYTIPTASFPDPSAPPGYSILRNGVRIDQEFSGPSYIDATVVPGSTYTYTVAAQDAIGTYISDFSGPLVIVVPFTTALLFGGFSPADTYKPIMLANVKGIKPRVYVPIQNTTVSTKQ